MTANQRDGKTPQPGVAVVSRILHRFRNPSFPLLVSHNPGFPNGLLLSSPKPERGGNFTIAPVRADHPAKEGRLAWRLSRHLAVRGPLPWQETRLGPPRVDWSDRT